MHDMRGVEMSEEAKHRVAGESGEEFLGRGPVTRRQFLKTAGLAGAVVGAGGGLAGLLAACGGGSPTTSASAASTATSGVATTSSSAATSTSSSAVVSSTTVSSQAETGREIKLGFVYPETGFLAFFGPGDKWSLSRWKEFIGQGKVLGDGKNHPINIISYDTQSDTNRASQVAGDLISNNNVDMLMAAGSALTCNPVSDQGEAAGVPVLNVSCPWETWFYARKGDPAVGFKWTFVQNSGMRESGLNYVYAWNQIPSNKKVGCMFGNDADGLGWADEKTGLAPYLKDAGYTVVDPGRFQPGTEDYTQQIQVFKKAGVEVVMAVMTPPDFTNFWHQVYQQGLRSSLKSAGVSLALLFEATCEAIGPTVYNTHDETSFHKDFPYKSTLTGETCAQLADSYSAFTKQVWAFPIIHYSAFEWAFDALKRAKNPENKDSILEAILATNMTTVGGPLDLTAPVKMGTPHPVKNAVTCASAIQQWQKGTSSTEPYLSVLIGSGVNPEVKATPLLPLPTV
jgi:branched-chain amino acid transport system substrate-binding protein